MSVVVAVKPALVVMLRAMHAGILVAAAESAVPRSLNLGRNFEVLNYFLQYRDNKDYKQGHQKPTSLL